MAAVNNHFEVGFNLDYYEQDVRSAYQGIVDSQGFAILHDSRLQLVPATVDFRLLPAGRHAIRGREGRQVLHPVPYFGAGLGFNFWEYEEVGDFVDFSDPLLPIFPDRFLESGTTFEAHALAGLELPVGPAWSVLLEGRYSWSDVTPNGDFAGLGSLELDGLSAYVGFAFHF